MEGLSVIALQQELMRRRSRYNTAFAQARHTYPGLEAQAFGLLVRELLEPAVCAVAALAPERVPAVTEALFDRLLELTARGLVGEGARVPLLRAAWAMLASAPNLLSEDPAQVVGAICNAVVTLANGGVGTREWIEAMGRAAGNVDHAAAWLNVGKVLGWRCGMARYRASALELAARLRPEHAAIALGIDGLQSEEQLRAAVAALAASPWRRGLLAGPPSLRMVGMQGGFRGFGGPLLAPPRVGLAHGRLVATDGISTWQIWADCFGVELTNMPSNENGVSWNPSQTMVGEDGTVCMDGEARAFPIARGASSAACDGSTLVVALAHSYRVLLFARVEEP